jgi:hypothetical protein
VVTSHGVTVEIAVDEPRLLPGVVAVLPPGWERGDSASVTARFALGRGGRVCVDGAPVRMGGDEAGALAALDRALRAVVALNSPDRVFIHAGVVARDGLAIVLPGASGSGKTSLVAALVRAGATYFSDEFAVLDSEGQVHPYPKPLSLRALGAFAQVDVPAEKLGAVGSGPVEVALIALTMYTPGESDLHAASAGAGALALLSHAVAARTRSAAVLKAVRAAATGAVYLEGSRGEAEPTARWLLSLIDVPVASQGTLSARSTQSLRGA